MGILARKGVNRMIQTGRCTIVQGIPGTCPEEVTLSDEIAGQERESGPVEALPLLPSRRQKVGDERRSFTRLDQ